MRYDSLSEEDKKKVEELLKVIETYKPWEKYPHIWKTKASFFSYMRGMQRSLWSRKWRPKIEYQNENSFQAPVLDENGNQTYYKSGKKKGQPVMRKSFKCELTGEILPIKEANIDHHPIPAGSCNHALDVCLFLFRLLTTKDNMRIISKESHKIVTHMERYGLTWEEAVVDKKCIEALKLPVDKQKKILIDSGFKEKEISNKENRKKCFKKLFKN